MAECIIIVNGGGGVGSDELTAQKAHVLKGYTYVGKDTNDESGVGDIEIKHAHTHDPSVAGQLGIVGNQLYVRFPSAYYQVQNGVNPYVYVANSDLAKVIGIEADKMLSTENVLGIQGTVSPMWTGWKQICCLEAQATNIDEYIDQYYDLGSEFYNYNTFLFKCAFTSGASATEKGKYTYQDTCACSRKADDMNLHTIVPNNSNNASWSHTTGDIDFSISVSSDCKELNVMIEYCGESETKTRYGWFEVVLIAAMNL